MMKGNGSSQLIPLDLAADGLGQLVTEDHHTGIFIWRGVGLDVILDLFFQLFGALGSLGQHDAGLDDLTAHLIRHGGNAAFQHVGQLHDDAFDLERPDAVAGRLDDVVHAAHVPVEAVLIPPGGVAGMVIAVVPGLLRLLLVAVIALEQAAGDFFGGLDHDHHTWRCFSERSTPCPCRCRRNP